MTSMDFSREEFNDMIYAARDAGIRFKRARTEFNKGNESYSQWTLEDLDERIQHYKRLELRLASQYEQAFGDVW